MKAKIITILIAGILAVVIAYLACGYYCNVDLKDKIITIVIEPGDNFKTVRGRLISEGVVNSKIMLDYPAYLRGIDKKLTPGRYDFTGKNSCKSVLDKLARADFVKIKVTIPEGATIWKTASILSDKMKIDSAEFVSLNRDTVFFQSMNLPGLEGFLFPETYYFPWEMNAKDVIAEMVRLYDKLTRDIWPDSIPHNLTRYEIINLASIIEAESKIDVERPLIASVYLNRLIRNMKLDADPTVIYGLGGLERPLYKRDLKKDTPYNTYLHKGLPPTPINSPGLASIKAALNPKDTDYLYFVADNNGGHYFSRTNAEHNRAKKKIKSEENIY